MITAVTSATGFGTIQRQSLRGAGFNRVLRGDISDVTVGTKRRARSFAVLRMTSKDGGVCDIGE